MQPCARCLLAVNKSENRSMQLGLLKATAWLTRRRLFGFLLGATTSGAGMYYYVIDEYRVSNQLLTEDIYVRRPLSLDLPSKAQWPERRIAKQAEYG